MQPWIATELLEQANDTKELNQVQLPFWLGQNLSTALSIRPASSARSRNGTYGRSNPLWIPLGWTLGLNTFSTRFGPQRIDVLGPKTAHLVRVARRLALLGRSSRG